MEFDLSFQRGDFLLRVANEVAMGELLIITGPSGAGKTTLLRLLAGLESPDRGRIACGTTLYYAAGAGPTANLTPQRRNIGFVFQDYALFPHLSVENNVSFGLAKNADQKIVRELLDRFQLTEFRDRKPAALSGGEQQRVALARALARQPKILLLDEPLSALDARLRRQLQVYLKTLPGRAGMGIIVVSHEEKEISRLADRVLKLEAGRVVYDGPPITTDGLQRANVEAVSMNKDGSTSITLLLPPQSATSAIQKGDQVEIRRS